MTATFDVVIVGGGAIGCATFYHVARTMPPGGSVLLLERCNTVANCASGRAGGFLARHWCDGERGLEQLARLSFDMHEQFAQQVGAERIGYRKIEAWDAQVSWEKERDAKSAAARSAESRNDDVAFLDGKAVSECSKLSKDGDTAQVHPRLLCEALVEEALKCNQREQSQEQEQQEQEKQEQEQQEQEQQRQIDATGKLVVCRTGVAGTVQRLIFNSSDSKCTGVVTADGTEITACRAVVLAVGPWMQHVASWLENGSNTGENAAAVAEAVSATVAVPVAVGGGIPQQALRQLSGKFRPHKVQSIIIDVPPQHRASLDKAIFTNSDEPAQCDPEIYPRPNGECYVCGISDSNPLPVDPAAVSGDPEKAAVLHSIAGKLCSALAAENGAKIAVAQACYLPTPPGGRRPLIGPVPGSSATLFIAAGHTCWGILKCHATGLAVAEMLLMGGGGIGGGVIAKHLQVLDPQFYVDLNENNNSSDAPEKNVGKRGNDTW